MSRERVASVRGSARLPYVVSADPVTAGWECSCPAWTRNTPRTDCKHILLVKLVLQGAVAARQADTVTFERTGRVVAERALATAVAATARTAVASASRPISTTRGPFRSSEVTRTPVTTRLENTLPTIAKEMSASKKVDKEQVKEEKSENTVLDTDSDARARAKLLDLD